jgi:hypothetical protein
VTLDFGRNCPSVASALKFIASKSESGELRLGQSSPIMRLLIFVKSSMDTFTLYCERLQEDSETRTYSGRFWKSSATEIYSRYINELGMVLVAKLSS